MKCLQALLLFALLLFAFSFPAPAFAACIPPTDKTVLICTPVNGASVTSPVQFIAGASDSAHPISAMILYVDSVNRAKVTNTSTLTATVSLAAGKHAITVRAWDTSGVFFSSSESITVTTNNNGPAVSISASPTSITSGQSSLLTVSAQNSTQVVVTDNIDTNTYNLPGTGGTVSVTPAQTATYTATATASNGATATASATITVGSTSNGITAVKHVLFMLQENRSFDSYFGMLNPYRHSHNFEVGDDGVTYTVDGIDDKLAKITNLDDEGDVFHLFHTTSSCLDDMTSAWLESYGQVSRYNFTTTRKINMDGFVHIGENFAKSGSGSGSFTDLKGQRAMAYYREMDTAGVNPELNYYYYMASQFALSDRWFSPVASKTIPNRLATLSGGTTQGYVWDPANNDHAPQLNAQTIFQLLDKNNITWKIYYAHTNPDGTPSTSFSYFGYSGKYIYRNSNGQLVIDSTHIAPIGQYFQDVANDALPQFSYIETNYGSSDEHPGSGQSILSGQQTVENIINSLMYSQSWSSSVFFFSFDEAGGPYDHVPPVTGSTNKFTSPGLVSVEGDVAPIAVNPDQYLPCVPATPGVYTNHCDLRPKDPGAHPNDVAALHGFAAQIGFRVPNFIISPFARRHYVGHNAMDHTAVLRFLEQRFNLPPLTKRDAAQPSLLNFFDFNNVPWATPPSQSSLPVAPPVGSTCHPAVMQ